MEFEPKKILLVDDDPLVIRMLSRLLQKIRPQDRVISAHTYKEASIRLDRDKFDIVISDYFLPDGNGKMVFDQSNPKTFRVGISGSAEKPDFGVNCDHFMQKPFGIKDIQSLFTQKKVPLDKLE